MAEVPEPPSLREIELETLLREREAQLLELTDEVVYLRRYLTNQPAPSFTDPVSLPPTLLSILQSYVAGQSSKDAPVTSSSTVTAALVQRTRTLQGENDELYNILQSSKTGQLMEEVRSLKKTVSQLSRALKDAHSTINNLNDEVDKSYTNFLAHQEDVKMRRDSMSPPRVPKSVQGNASNGSNKNGDMRNIPTGPRAHKKPKIDASPSQSPVSQTLSIPNSTSFRASSTSHSGRRDRSPRESGGGRGSPAKELRMDDDDDVKKARDKSREHHERGKDRPRDNAKERGRDHQERERDRGREPDRRKTKEKEREKEREHDRARRNGRGSGGGGGGSGRKGGRGNAADDRTLRQRLGL